MFNAGREYDIIYVDWINGMDYMERNAYALEEAIKWVNSIKQGNEPNVIIGQSMGGVVTRYALTDMENNSLAHETNLFISHDAPHQGANIPDSYQFMYRHLTQMYVKVKSGTRILNLKLIPKDLINKMNNVVGMLDQPASKQLLRYWVAGNYSYNNSEHYAFYTALRAMNSNGGYPTLTRNIALSNGSECGATQFDVQPNANLLNIHFSNKPTILSDVIGSAIGPIAGAYGAWLFKDWNVFLTGLKATISSKKKLTLDLWAKTMSETASLQQHVYHADLTYHQKVLFVINDNTNIFHKDAYSRSGTEFSHFGGGNFQIYDDTNVDQITKFNYTGIVDYNIKPRFNFIPTTSALDIGKYIHTIGSNNLRASYVGATPPTGIYSSPFANFSTDFNPINDNYHNFRHITFNPRNGQWLASELNAARNSNNNQLVTDCSIFCGESEITGSDFICDGANYTYSIPELAGVTINWSVSGLQIVSGQNTSNLVVKDNGGINPKSILVTINSSTCGAVTLSKNVHAGTPFMIGSIAGWNVIQTNGNQQFSFPLTYTAPNTTGATYYEWILPGNYQLVSQLGVPTDIPQNWELLASTANSNIISVRSPLSGSGQIKVRACNECGCSTYISLDVSHQHNPGMPGFEIAPNPTTGDVLNIMRVESAPVVEFPGNRTDVFIYNLQAQRVHQFEITNQGGSTNVAHLTNGIYKVHIDMKNGSFEVLNLSISR
ncbi:GPI inositol-deacylase [Paenimyroides aestuarii]|uniref:GPI inositol-deacylase n=1 Tax=Paenimyroides aestuarii TaxID=2968490 RepID=A0ABY5NUU6_9FLAO|nr:GPI inositol-deacylase [Paenimyroides aestuarii]UUV22124.1 GPI inositol-deacylase [Paenimyroides aestuarii]